MAKRTWPVVLHLTVKPLQERHFVTLAIIAMIAGMLLMAREDPDLWEVELFKTLLTAFALTGFLNMVVSFHFSANKADEAKTENTTKAFEAVRAVAEQRAPISPDAAEAADQVATAAEEEAARIAEGEKK